MIYDYSCTNCEKEWEEEHSIKSPPITLCPFCKNETAKRLISSSSSFILKGQGWFKDGYCSPSQNITLENKTTPKQNNNK